MQQSRPPSVCCFLILVCISVPFFPELLRSSYQWFSLLDMHLFSYPFSHRVRFSLKSFSLSSQDLRDLPLWLIQLFLRHLTRQSTEIIGSSCFILHGIQIFFFSVLKTNGWFHTTVFSKLCASHLFFDLICLSNLLLEINGVDNNNCIGKPEAIDLDKSKRQIGPYSAMLSS